MGADGFKDGGGSKYREIHSGSMELSFPERFPPIPVKQSDGQREAGGPRVEEGGGEERCREGKGSHRELQRRLLATGCRERGKRNTELRRGYLMRYTLELKVHSSDVQRHTSEINIYL